MSTTGTTGATAAAIPAFPNQFSYLCGFSIDATATAAAVGVATVATVGQGAGITMSFEQGTGTSPATVQTFRTFYPCLRSNAQNTAITVTSAAPGAAGAVTVNAWGYTR